MFAAARPEYGGKPPAGAALGRWLGPPRGDDPADRLLDLLRARKGRLQNERSRPFPFVDAQPGRGEAGPRMTRFQRHGRQQTVCHRDPRSSPSPPAFFRDHLSIGPVGKGPGGRGPRETHGRPRPLRNFCICHSGGGRAGGTGRGARALGRALAGARKRCSFAQGGGAKNRSVPGAFRRPVGGFTCPSTHDRAQSDSIRSLLRQQDPFREAPGRTSGGDGPHMSGRRRQPGDVETCSPRAAGRARLPAGPTRKRRVSFQCARTSRLYELKSTIERASSPPTRGLTCPGFFDVRAPRTSPKTGRAPSLRRPWSPSTSGGRSGLTGVAVYAGGRGRADTSFEGRAQGQP